MEFKNFKKDVEAAFNNMIAENLFVANVDKDLLWMGYLLSFEDETIRQDHNCNACKSFIRHYGKVVAIDPQTYKVKTFWDDVHTPGYEKTASDLAKLVKEAGIGDIFIQDVNEFHGCDHNVQLLPDGTTRTWTHLYVTIPNKFKFNKRVHHFDSAAGYRGDVRARAGVFERSLSELKLSAVETVIELIEDNNLYRGEEFLKTLQASKMKLRFATSKGNLSVEDLWDLSLPALDRLAVSYDEELAKSPRKSFITNDTPSNSELELKFNIVKDVITDKLKDKAAREAAKDKAAEKARLTELLAKKQSEKMESMSEDEIRQRLAELG